MRFQVGLLRDRVEAVIGADHPSAAMVVDSIPGLILVRSVLMGEKIDPKAIADEVVTLAASLT